MKTIEERVSTIANKMNWNSNFSDGFCDGYIQGATEQRDIDIERVWNYFETAVCHWVEENDLPKAKEQFIKYMKGE